MQMEPHCGAEKKVFIFTQEEIHFLPLMCSLSSPGNFSCGLHSPEESDCDQPRVSLSSQLKPGLFHMKTWFHLLNRTMTERSQTGEHVMDRKQEPSKLWRRTKSSDGFIHFIVLFWTNFLNLLNNLFQHY